MMNNKLFYIEDEFTGNLNEISELFSTEYKKTDPICNTDYLRWLYELNPHGKAIISCARDKNTNKLVGVYLVNPISLWLNGEKQLAALSLNTFTHKDFRGQGMFTILANTCYDIARKKGVKCIVGFPNKSSYGGFVKFGFEIMGTIPYLIKPLNYFNLAKNILLKSRTLTSISSINADKYDQIVHVDGSSINQLEGFFYKHREKCLFQTYRTISQYKWRFFDKPNNKYRIFAGKDDTNQITSVIVLNTVASITSDIQVVDFCCLDEKSGDSIMKFLFKEAKSQFTMVRIFAQKETLEYRVLSKLGFVKKDKWSKNKVFLPFIYKDLQSKGQKIPFDEWHISFADSDVV